MDDDSDSGGARILLFFLSFFGDLAALRTALCVASPRCPLLLNIFNDILMRFFFLVEFFIYFFLVAFVLYAAEKEKKLLVLSLLRFSVL